ncbi:hypothetical protein KIPB_007746, partial [Kipferlia bialata]
EFIEEFHSQQPMQGLDEDLVLLNEHWMLENLMSQVSVKAPGEE